MRSLTKLMAMAAIIASALWSCSGGGADTLLFGKLPGVYAGMLADKEAIREEAKSVSSASQMKDLSEKADKLQEEWAARIEEAARGLDGREIEFAESDITVTKPLSLTYEGFFSKSSMTPDFIVSGEAEASADIIPESKLPLTSYTVYIVGYDAAGQEVFANKVGFIPAEMAGGKSVIKAGTPVDFDHLYFSEKKAEDYPKAAVLKLEVRE